MSTSSHRSAAATTAATNPLQSPRRILGDITNSIAGIMRKIDVPSSKPNLDLQLNKKKFQVFCDDDDDTNTVIAQQPRSSSSSSAPRQHAALSALSAAYSDISDHETSISDIDLSTCSILDDDSVLIDTTTAAALRRAAEQAQEQHQQQHVADDTTHQLKELYDQLEDLNQKNERVVEQLQKEQLRCKRMQIRHDEDQLRIRELTASLQQQQQKPSSSSPNGHEISILQERLRRSNEKLAQATARAQELQLQKQKLATQIASQERQIQKLTEVTEQMNKAEDDLNRHQEARLESMMRALQAESARREELEQKTKRQEGELETLRVKLNMAKEENESTDELLRTMEEKLKRTNAQCLLLEERIRAERDRSDKAALDCANVRAEMSQLYDHLIEEKKKHEDAVKQLMESQENGAKLRDVLQQLEASQRSLAQSFEDKTHELQGMLNESDQRRKQIEQREAELQKRYDELHGKYLSMESECMRQTQEIRDQQAQVQQQQKRAAQLQDKVKQMESQSKEMVDVLEAKEQHIKELNETIVGLQKRMEKEQRQAGKSIGDAERKLEQELQNARSLQQQLSDTKIESDRYCQMIDRLQEELQREKKRSDTTRKMAEEAAEAHKQTRTELENQVRSYAHSLEVAELKYANKVVMLDKKCSYLSKMCTEFRNTSDADVQRNLLQEQLLSALSDSEKLADELTQLKSTSSSKDLLIKDLNEKIRQLEELIEEKHRREAQTIKQQQAQGAGAVSAKSNKKQHVSSSSSQAIANALKTVAAEKFIDEILIECRIDGLAPGKLTARDKAAAITLRIQQLVEQLSESNRGKQELYIQLENTKVWPKSAQTNRRWFVAFKTVFDHLKQLETKNDSESFAALLQNAILQVKKTMEDIIALSTSKELSSPVDALEALDKLRAVLAQTEERLKTSESTCSTLQQELDTTKKQLAETVNTCAVYKKLIEEFTRLSEQQQQQEEQQKAAAASREGSKSRPQSASSRTATQRRSSSQSSNPMIVSVTVSSSSEQQQQSENEAVSSYASRFKQRAASMKKQLPIV